MKISKAFSMVIALALVLILTGPGYAQLGDTDTSSFTVQNVSGSDNVEVTIKFIAEDGLERTPSDLGGGRTNPFYLDDGKSVQIVVSEIPSSQLPSGRYSVVISSSDKVVVVANLEGTGTNQFSGSYMGFSQGASTFYLVSTYYNFYDWYSMISVQNLSSDSDANVTLTITCEDLITVGTLSATIPPHASVTWPLKSTTPTGFTAGVTQCRGSSVITADQSIVVAENQNKPLGGNTLSVVGLSSGTTKVYIPALYNSHWDWNSGLVIRKLEAGDTKVTINYTDGESDECDLTDSVPFCALYMPNYHTATGAFGATLTTSPGKQIAAIANSTKGTLSMAYNGLGPGVGSQTVGLPVLYKGYFQWNSAWTCQNVGSIDTQINVTYEDFEGDAYDYPDTLKPGDMVRVYQPNETFLPTAYMGGAIITAKAIGAEIACIANLTNANWEDPTKPGDWSASYNGIPK